MTGYRQLAERVAAAGGLMHVSVEELRDLEGAGKLGTHVRESIERNLAKVELKLLERRIPNDQRELVLAHRTPDRLRLDHLGSGHRNPPDAHDVGGGVSGTVAEMHGTYLYPSARMHGSGARRWVSREPRW